MMGGGGGWLVALASLLFYWALFQTTLFSRGKRNAVSLVHAALCSATVLFFDDASMSIFDSHGASDILLINSMMYFILDTWYEWTTLWTVHHVFAIVAIFTGTYVNPLGAYRYLGYAEMGGVAYNLSALLKDSITARVMFIVFYARTRLHMNVVFMEVLYRDLAELGGDQFMILMHCMGYTSTFIIMIVNVYFFTTQCMRLSSMIRRRLNNGKTIKP